MRTLIIAEAGVNHNGDLSKAKQLIDVAADAGADLVKFQTFKADSIVSKLARKAEYQIRNTGKSNSQYDMLKRLELSIDDHLELIDHCDKKGVTFFSTAFDTSGLLELNSLGFDRFKIPSGEITNYPYLKLLAKLKKPVIISTGMANMEEIGEAIRVLTSEGLGLNDITILHCNTEYPTPMKDVNLKAMLSIQKKFGVKIGYSDHTLGIEVPIAAVALGASVIEKHFTLSRNLPGPDHRASLEPQELVAMVKSIRNIEMALLGSGIKRPSESEVKNKFIARKSIFLAANILKGQVLKEEDLISLRPGDGMSPMLWPKIIGRKVKYDLPAGHQLKLTDLS
ncbi:N-acetylneuraminate synthase [uncultured Roseivirga sp.]|uniref:N-acetylneuraminate synthase n=1 Tax=uncultured Roseivirga sp. TaxID=543088 RepID=UPI0025884F6A|nr:N-acetylneuraminate synthase [uncultured Roseivirga sp.]